MQQISFLYEAAQAVLSTYDLDEVLNRILAIARDHFHLENGAILLCDEKSGELNLHSFFGREHSISNRSLPPSRGLTGAAFRTKQTVYVPDVAKDPRYIKGIEETRSELALPLIVNGTSGGVMDFQSEQIDNFGQETIDLLTLFATQASVALQNAQLYSMVQKRAAQLETINTIAKQSTLEVGLTELLTRFCSQLPKSFPVDHVAVLLREADSDGPITLRGQFGTLRPHLSSAALTELLERLEVAPKEESQRLVATGKQRWFEEARSEVALPLVSFGRHLGILLCASKQPGGFTENDLRALESVADILATSVQNAMYVEAVRQLAYRDGLTGIFNRRYFEMKILDELARASRYSGAVSILMIDIDHFKAINDEFGHLLGDEVLKQVATIFGKVLRKVDVSCRYGGEEFAVILPATRLNSARAVADKLRQSIETYEFPGIPRPITISIGVSEAPSHGMARDQLVSAADAALYQSKQSGRNRVSCGILSQA